MIVVLAVLATLGVVLFPTGRFLGRRAYWAAASGLGLSFGWLLTRYGTVTGGRSLIAEYEWVPALGLGVELRLDGFGLVMALVITGIGAVVAAFAATYFDASSDDAARSAGLLVVFAAAMLTVVFADNLLLLYTGWELTSVTSYLLIGNDHTKLRARAAALHALLVTSLGGLVMLAGFVLIGEEAGTYRLSGILASPPSGTAVEFGLVCVLIGAFTKSAQYPFHSWLPGAMAAPTPISAYLHSATMVKAGVYLVARFAPAFAGATVWRPLVLTVGAVTMIAGGLRALRQHDLKLLLAFGTVSQLGLLMVLFGAGTPGLTAAGTAMLLAHALFKAALFMSVGTLDHRLGTRDLRRLPPLGPAWRWFSAATIAVAASMAGVPLLLGFIGKEAGIAALVEADFVGARWLLVAVVVGAALTAAYAARFVWGFLGDPVDRLDGGDPSPTSTPPGWLLVGPMLVLATASVLYGTVPRLLDVLVGSAALDLDPRTTPIHLAVWHGFNSPLVLSAVALGGGATIFAARRAVERLLAVGAGIPSGAEAYVGVLRAVNRFADRVTGVVQNGSLPIYAGVTLATAALVPGIVLLGSTTWPGLPRFAASPAQVAMVAVVLAAAAAAAATRRRFSAALFLGVVGYAMAGVFVVQGAPDLALTQVAIETLSTVLFVLVLRRLPDRFERTSSVPRRVVRVIIAGVVGVTVFAFAVISRAARTAEPVSGEMIARSYPEGHGRNVVNVILVDIRGLDTMAEITVLASAAIGAVALARVGRRRSVAQQETK